MLLDMRIEPKTVHIPGRRRSDQATAPGNTEDIIFDSHPITSTICDKDLNTVVFFEARHKDIHVN